MKKIRFRNWLLLKAFMAVYLVLTIYGVQGFWTGFLPGISLAIFIGELYWMLRGREVKGYALHNTSKEAK